jgi:DNA-binding GntR family transcriptional regulator
MEVKNHLMNVIDSGQLAPLCKLPSEKVLCEKFGINRHGFMGLIIKKGK